MYKICLTILDFIFKKALGKNNIPNLILKLFINFLLSHLYQIFNKCLNMRFCLIHFWSSITVVLCKLEKPDYITAKAYHSIALLNILKKAFKFILAKKITYLVKIYRLLFYNHFGARQTRSTKHVLHYIVKRIYSL